MGHIKFRNIKKYVKFVQRIIMKERFKQLKSFNWRLFTALCTLALIPAIYQTVKTFIISSNAHMVVHLAVSLIEEKLFLRKVETKK